MAVMMLSEVCSTSRTNDEKPLEMGRLAGLVAPHTAAGADDGVVVVLSSTLTLTQCGTAAAVG